MCVHASSVVFLDIYFTTEAPTQTLVYGVRFQKVKHGATSYNCLVAVCDQCGVLDVF